MTLLKNKEEEEETSKSHRQIGEKKNNWKKKIRLFSPGRAEVINFKIKNKKKNSRKGAAAAAAAAYFYFLNGGGRNSL